MGDRTWPEVGVPDRLIAAPVDLPETVVAVIEQDAAGVQVDVLQPVARSVDTEDPDHQVGGHGPTVGRPDATRQETKVLSPGDERHLRADTTQAAPHPALRACHS